jgi:hypothetical protein
MKNKEGWLAFLTHILELQDENLTPETGSPE